MKSRLSEYPRLLRLDLRRHNAAFLWGPRKVGKTAYWRTSTGLEVDLVVGDLDLAIEFKASRQADGRDVKSLRALMDDQKVRESVLVSQDTVVRKLSGDITVYPWQRFCEKLWAGGFRGLE